MARKNEKKGYEGPKLDGDTRNYRDERLKRAQKNAQGEQITNEVFAVQDENFKKACEQASVKPTKRQASKFRNKYGAAARAANISTRKATA